MVEFDCGDCGKPLVTVASTVERLRAVSDGVPDLPELWVRVGAGA